MPSVATTFSQRGTWIFLGESFADIVVPRDMRQWYWFCRDARAFRCAGCIRPRLRADVSMRLGKRCAAGVSGALGGSLRGGSGGSDSHAAPALAARVRCTARRCECDRGHQREAQARSHALQFQKFRLTCPVSAFAYCNVCAYPWGMERLDPRLFEEKTSGLTPGTGDNVPTSEEPFQ